MPSASFDDKKNSDFLGESFAARGTRARTNVGVLVRQGQRGARADATRRGRRGYFARQAAGGEDVDLAVGREVAAWATMGSQAISVVAKIS